MVVISYCECGRSSAALVPQAVLTWSTTWHNNGTMEKTSKQLQQCWLLIWVKKRKYKKNTDQHNTWPWAGELSVSALTEGLCKCVCVCVPVHQGKPCYELDQDVRTYQPMRCNPLCVCVSLCEGSNSKHCQLELSAAGLQSAWGEGTVYLHYIWRRG